jgi:hypothetical protein
MLLLVSLMIAAGCGPPAPADDVGSGVHIVNLRQAEDGFKSVATRGNARVTLTVSRLGLRSEGFVRDPEIDSPYEADLIVRNRHDFPFLTSGNHGVPDDADGGVVSLESPSQVNHYEQVEDLQLAVDAADRLRSQTGLGEMFRWELRSLHYLAAGALERADDVITGRLEATPTEVAPSPTPAPTAGKALQSWGWPAPTYIHRISIRYAACCNSLGHHSAVLFEVFSGDGTFIGSISTKNHGREASDPSMVTATGCPRAWSGRTTVFPNFRPYLATDFDFWGANDAGGCHTYYGLWPGSHACNDDSQAQYWNIKYNVSGTWAICEDAKLNWWAPHCD